MRLLLVEDDYMIGESLQKALRKSGYAVDWVQGGEDVEPALKGGDYALIILDLGLPGQDGLSVLCEMRQKNNTTPVLILSARDSIADKVKGLDIGADDYMLKPFAIEELEARIRLLSRRQNTHQVSAILKHGPLTINMPSHSVQLNDQNVSLSSKEFSLLTIMMEKPRAVFSRAQFEEKLYGWNEEVASNAIEVHIHQIRKKLGKNIIKNNRNVGYSLGDISEIN